MKKMVQKYKQMLIRGGEELMQKVEQFVYK
jgi:hypothetical protein